MVAQEEAWDRAVAWVIWAIWLIIWEQEEEVMEASACRVLLQL